nr:unnamed protein product [Callosobruchus chinensis]
MKTFWVLLFLVLNHDISNSLPAKNQCDQTVEISTVLQNKCSSLASSDIFTKQLEVLKGCPKWCQLKEIRTLGKDNEKDVLCLLFANSILSFCTTFKNATIKDVDLIPPSTITVASVCSKLLSPKQNAEFNISAIIPKKKHCEAVCSNYYGDTPVMRECAIAYYYASGIANITQKPSDLTSSIIKGSMNDEKDVPEVDHKQIIQEQIHHKQDAIGDIHNEIDSVKPAGGSVTPVNVNKKTEQLQEESPKHKKAAKQKPSGEIVTRGENLQTSTKGKIEQKLQGDQALQGAGSVPHLDTAPAGSMTQHTMVSVKSEPSAAAAPVLPSIKDNSEHGPDEQFADNIQDHPPMHLQDSVAVEANLPVENGGENTEPKIEEEEEAIVPKEEETSAKERLNHLGFSKDDEEDNTYDDEIGTAYAKLVKKKLITSGEPASYNNLDEMDGESYFFSYFMVVCVLFVLGYVVYHNRQKVLALVLEGKRSKTQYRSRRPNSANYHKLDTNLEEAISSNCNKNSSHVIY